VYIYTQMFIQRYFTGCIIVIVTVTVFSVSTFCVFYVLYCIVLMGFAV